MDAIRDDTTGVVYNAAYCVALTFFKSMQVLSTYNSNLHIPGTHKTEFGGVALGDIHYGKALTILSRNLSDPGLRHSANNVVAVIMLSLYEVSIVALYNDTSDLYRWLHIQT